MVMEARRIARHNEGCKCIEADAPAWCDALGLDATGQAPAQNAAARRGHASAAPRHSARMEERASSSVLQTGDSKTRYSSVLTYGSEAECGGVRSRRAEGLLPSARYGVW